MATVTAKHRSHSYSFIVKGNTSAQAQSVAQQSMSGISESQVVESLQNDEIVASSGGMRKMLANIEQLKNMQIVGGSSRLGRLIDFMQSKRVQKTDSKAFSLRRSEDKDSVSSSEAH